jgi:(E)-4-hydroxy-3-methylbut-2-enyl-diphosphate synthase
MTKKVKIGNVYIGGGEVVKIQSMTTFKPSDIKNTINQILELENAGCDLARFSVADENDAKAIKEIKKHTHIPLIADIHFDYRLGIKSIENGIDKIRINPGNIGSNENIKKIADVLKEYDLPVRVGSNTGSIEKEFLNKYGRTEKALVESALKNVAILEKYGVNNIVISVKASSVPMSVKAYQLISKQCNYPLHLGITEAGTYDMGIVKSSIGIGSLLLAGIGDTIRVSLTDNPVNEIYAAKRILRAAEIDKNYIEIISCPTCGRCEWNSLELAKKTEEFTSKYNIPLKVAVMGCIVNGPGEAKECDLGIAGGKTACVIFKKGVVIKTVPIIEAETEFLKEIEKLINESEDNR